MIATSAIAHEIRRRYGNSSRTYFREPVLAVLLSVLCLAGVGGTAASLAIDAPAAYAGTNDDSI